MQDYEKEEEGISFGELFRVIFKRGWILAVVTLAVTVIAIVSVAFFVNSNKKEYRIDYSMTFPGYENLRYPDGTAFRHQEIISLETLNAVKNSDEAFSSVDTEKMSEQNDIMIISQTTEVSGSRIPTGNYTLTVKASYFSSAEAASSFLRKLAYVPVDYIQSVVENASYDFNLTAYNSVTTYESKIEYLAAQREFLADKYSELIIKYGESYRYEGRSISEYSASASLQFAKTAEKMLLTELDVNGYVYDKDSFKATAALQTAALQREKTENEKTLTALRAELAETPTLAEGKLGDEVASLLKRNVQIDTELETIRKTLENLGDKDSTAFDTRLTGYYNNLKSATETYHKVVAFIYDRESDVIFDTNKAIVQGGTSLILAAVGGLVGGFILACVIVCAIDLPKYFRAKKNGEQPQEDEKTEEEPKQN